MKCKKCGTELGQKNLCPVCGPSAVSKSPIPEIVKFEFPDADLKKITLFLIQHRNTWNIDFDSFYDEFPSAPDYKELFSFCRKCFEIISEIKEILSGTDILSAELIIKIMDEITQRYPGITNSQVRLMTKAVFASKDPADGAENDPLPETVLEQCWFCRHGLNAKYFCCCPVCHGGHLAVTPQWLKTVRNDKIAIEEKLSCVAEELLRVINDVIAHCDDLTSEEREYRLLFFQPISELDFSVRGFNHFLNDLDKALDINFGVLGWDLFGKVSSPYDLLKNIADKYLPETVREENGEYIFKVRYDEMLRAKFE